MANFKNSYALNDSDLMPWGKHKGIAMANVPATYFLYLWDNNMCHGPVKQYIYQNLNVLKQEVNNAK